MQQKLIKKIKGIDISNLALKSNLAQLKAGVDKIDADKLKNVLTDLNKLSNVVDIRLWKTVYDKLVAKLKNINTEVFLLKTK